jgi:hypothetical protein
MDGEADILQHRGQAVALQRRERHALERIGGNEDEGEEGNADPGLHRQGVRLHPVGEIVAEDGDRRPEQRQDEHPQQHRAFVIAPHARDLEDQRLLRVGVLDDVEEREVGGDVGVHQGCEGDADQQELRHCRRARYRHQPSVARPCPPNRQDALKDGDHRRQDQREMADFGNHCVAVAGASSPCHSPCSFSALTTSAGM